MWRRRFSKASVEQEGKRAKKFRWMRDLFSLFEGTSLSCEERREERGRLTLTLVLILYSIAAPASSSYTLYSTSVWLVPDSHVWRETQTKFSNFNQTSHFNLIMAQDILRTNLMYTSATQSPHSSSLSSRLISGHQMDNEGQTCGSRQEQTASLREIGRQLRQIADRFEAERKNDHLLHPVAGLSSMTTRLILLYALCVIINWHVIYLSNNSNVIVNCQFCITTTTDLRIVSHSN